MKRPYPVHFLAVSSGEFIHIKASLAVKSTVTSHPFELAAPQLSPSSPWDSIALIRSKTFKLKVIGLSDNQEKIFSKEFESDSFGNFQIKIPSETTAVIQTIQVFETSYRPGLDISIGTYLPIILGKEKRIVISDFDKTLVDTRYSTTSEVYRSLTKPMSYFPKIDKSIEIFKSYIEKGFQPFILTASPHFYENAIRDWLYNNEIYTAGIFLKDYRKILSFLEDSLSPKDFKTQGFYKLDHLVTILLMTGIPEELVLLGDGFESDPMIYLTLAELLSTKHDPWSLWNTVKGQEEFKLTRRQNAQFLSKIYLLYNMAKEKPIHRQNIKIFIRQKGELSPLKFKIEALTGQKDLIETYLA